MVSKTEEENSHPFWYFVEIQKKYQEETYPHIKSEIEYNSFVYLKKKFFETGDSLYKGYDSCMSLQTDSDELLGCVIARAILMGKENNSFSVREGCCKKELLVSYLHLLLEDCKFSIIVLDNKEEGKFVIDLEKNL